MPVMGGERAFDSLRAIRPDVPILLASGYDETDELAKTADREFTGFFAVKGNPDQINPTLKKTASLL